MNTETPTTAGKTILLISPYWKEEHRWMVSSVKLAELWQRLGYRVVVVCMGSTEAVSGERVAVRVETVSSTLEIHRLHDRFLPDPWNYGISFGFSGYVGRLAKALKPDHIVVNKLLFWTTLSLIPLRLKGYRVLLLTDALVGMTWFPRGLIPALAARIYAWTLGWLLLLFASKVVTFHPQPEGLLRLLGIQQKTQVIPTGIDADRFKFAGLQVSGIDQQQTSNQQTSKLVTVTYIGRLESVKGVDDFLAAAVPLKKDFPTLNIQVIGWYKDKHPLVEQYRHEVSFTGLRDDIPEILKQSDIFVLPSHSEGLSNALMEAMASGCACIASDVGGNRFLIQNGVSGFLFPAGDREALAAHIRRLLDDPYKREGIGKAARERIEKEFDWSVVGKKYEQLFSQINGVSEYRTIRDKA